MEPPIPARVAFPWRPFVYAAVLLYLVLDLHVWQGPVHRYVQHRARGSEVAEQAPAAPGDPASVVATVNLRPITRAALDSKAREHLHARGLDYGEVSRRMRLQARVLVLEEMIDDEMLRQYTRLKPVEVPVELVDRRYGEFVSQFASQARFRERLRLRGMSEADLRNEIEEEVHQVLWIESKIAHVLEPDDEEVRAWYQAHAAELAVGEAVRACHIFLSTVHPESEGEEELIREIRARIVDGEDFGELAKAYSEDPRTGKRGGDLGWFTRRRMPGEFTDAVFAIAEGEMGEPFRTVIGWHLVKVLERAPARTPAFEEVREEIAAEIANSRRVAAVRSLLRSMRSRPKVVYYERAIRAEPTEREVVPARDEPSPRESPGFENPGEGEGREDA